MHKKLEADLISLAHSILQMKNRDDVFALKEKSQEVYEKLSVLAYAEKFLKQTPGLVVSKEEVMTNIETSFQEREEAVSQIEETSQKELPKIDKSTEKEVALENKVDKEEQVLPHLEEQEQKGLNEEEVGLVESTEEEKVILEKVEEIIEQPFDEIESLLFPKEEVFKKVEEKKNISLEEELKDTVSIDVVADLFEKSKSKSLNDKLQTNIQIGLNDRITFVKNLFEGSQEDFNRVISQLNSFKTEKEAKKFISKIVKPDYNWSSQEELEQRFMAIIERKFV